MSWLCLCLVTVDTAYSVCKKKKGFRLLCIKASSKGTTCKCKPLCVLFPVPGQRACLLGCCHSITQGVLRLYVPGFILHLMRASHWALFSVYIWWRENINAYPLQTLHSVVMNIAVLGDIIAIVCLWSIYNISQLQKETNIIGQSN